MLFSMNWRFKEGSSFVSNKFSAIRFSDGNGDDASRSCFGIGDFWSPIRATSAHGLPVETSLPSSLKRKTASLVHVAIDRFTGQVVDKQIEVVNE